MIKMWGFSAYFCRFQASRSTTFEPEPWMAEEPHHGNPWATLWAALLGERDSRNISWSVIRSIQRYVPSFIPSCFNGKSMTACKNVLLCRPDLDTQIKRSQVKTHTPPRNTRTHPHASLWATSGRYSCLCENDDYVRTFEGVCVPFLFRELLPTPESICRQLTTRFWQMNIKIG